MGAQQLAKWRPREDYINLLIGRGPPEARGRNHYATGAAPPPLAGPAPAE